MQEGDAIYPCKINLDKRAIRYEDMLLMPYLHDLVTNNTVHLKTVITDWSQTSPNLTPSWFPVSNPLFNYKLTHIQAISETQLVIVPRETYMKFMSPLSPYSKLEEKEFREKIEQAFGIGQC